MPQSREKKILKILYKDEQRYEDNLKQLAFGQIRGTSIMSLTKPNLNESDENLAKDKYEQLQLRLRKRIFSSLHYLPKFKSLTKEAQNFLFN